MIETKEITDLLALENLLKNTELWDRITEDGIDKQSFKIPENNNLVWIGYYNKNDLIGCFDLHPLNMTTLQVHINILEEFREEHSFECGVKILEYFVDTEKNWQKLFASIPVMNKDVYHFTKKFGFIDEGINRLSASKNGVLVDQHNLGITKKEAIEWLQQQ